MVARLDGRADVPVLERRAAAGVDLDPVRRDGPHDAVADGVDGRAVGSGDVDPLVVGASALAVQQAGGCRGAAEDRAGIAETTPHGVLLVERLDGPSVRPALGDVDGSGGYALHPERRPPPGSAPAARRRGEGEKGG